MKLTVVITLLVLCSCATRPAPRPQETFRPANRESVEFTNGGYAIVGEDISKENAS